MYPHVTRMYSYVSRMYSFVTRMYLYVTCTLLVCYSYVTCSTPGSNLQAENSPGRYRGNILM